MAKKPKDKVRSERMVVLITRKVHVNRVAITLTEDEVDEIILDHFRQKGMVGADVIQTEVEHQISSIGEYHGAEVSIDRPIGDETVGEP